ncbi:hypothetical protein B0H63DRAFT_187570 [Podospora didyma]|uniref:Myb-like domain-containing protein n=1 Tax=Podospora didyma TaxID=330526 RepID=A0AAE0TZV6_9PEZI|nr:hypothetical protein B0H63DRAFT_187570 [Podospora didyma]
MKTRCRDCQKLWNSRRQKRNSLPDTGYKRWNKEEDRLLIDVVQRGPDKKWEEIQLCFPERSANACRRRYYKLMDSTPDSIMSDYIPIPKSDIEIQGSIGSWGPLPSFGNIVDFKPNSMEDLVSNSMMDLDSSVSSCKRRVDFTPNLMPNLGTMASVCSDIVMMDSTTEIDSVMVDLILDSTMDFDLVMEVCSTP